MIEFMAMFLGVSVLMTVIFINVERLDAFIRIWDGTKNLVKSAFRSPTTIIERLKGNKLDAELKRLNGILETEIERGKKLEAELILIEKIKSRREHNDNTLKRYKELIEVKPAEEITEGE